ncbi:MAG: hypothetical protein KZQ64_16365 [gamma proteobacterium symbiont of Bathyaustriella thionipta]|nr:hypothetical protein [gamma proteobacterium symbiont of Bathyaustriella thionipta]MCU7949861.1 hypothetical protein [gamma proteobacterium symbiont of Bathyaustriella thionipta]MCU7954941.1 hypothetical protein [gamma proteobacterium symbiont of Bathyaustriella thionipta]MCU7956446.1 hypothetical protein [gamma proteobacterium symbiont of Bathyaustriella thionipta]MCU7966917.1 hypothetical protein [gamma proteobacterium symbiont of Bathyaustriella thionipta]
MSQVNLLEMADILLPMPSEQVMPIGIVLAFSSAGLICTVILFFIIRRHLTQPLSQLERYLKQGKLAPRKAAHQLAFLIREANRESDKQLLQQIDHLRFQRQSPKNSELLNLINRAKHGR